MNELNSERLEILHRIETMIEDTEKCVSPDAPCSDCKYKKRPDCVNNLLGDVLCVLGAAVSIIKKDD